MEYKALAIEDDPQAVEMIEEALLALGHTYDLARTLVEARRLIQSNDYPYALEDIAFPTRSPKGIPRVQNAENLLEEMLAAKGRKAPPVVIMSDRKVEHPDDTEHLMRLAMSLGHKGAVDLIQKPFPTAGRTLDRVIKKILGLATHNGAKPKAEPTAVPLARGVEEQWFTVTQAAELLAHDLPGLGIRKAKARVSRAASLNEFRINGKQRLQRRIEIVSLNAWRLQQRDRDLDREDEDRTG
jgi:CheY-like chemotaxis protein